MTIKKRFERRAYPSPLFMGYQLRFGTVMAAFASAKLQRLDLPGEPIKGPGFCGVTFHTRACVEELFNKAQDDALEAAYVAVIEDWPTVQSLIDASPYRSALFASITGSGPVTLSDNTEQTNDQAEPNDQRGALVGDQAPSDVRVGGKRIRRRRKISAVP